MASEFEKAKEMAYARCATSGSRKVSPTDFYEGWNACLRMVAKRLRERISELCDCDAPKSKYNTASGHAMNCPAYELAEFEKEARNG